MILRSRSARRAVRTVAGVVASLLLAGNVLAAAGLCVVKAPVAVEAASEDPCMQHSADNAPPAPAAQQHCPADDASAQVRGVDLPSAQAVAAAAVAPFGIFAVSAPPLRFAADSGSPQRPLYARLQRLQL
jgi:hypothetical protein